MALSKKQIEELLISIHDGNLSLFNLPKDVFEYNFIELMGSVESGFGGGVGDFAAGSIKDLKSIAYRENIFRFSGVKTANEVKDMLAFVFNDDGTKRSFKEFKEYGKAIDEKYNVNFLRTEQDTAFGMSQSSSQWLDIEEDKELFPLLKYQTAADERVRSDHAQWDGIVRPVDDPFWDTNMPINGWNCRCQVIKLTEGKSSSLKGIQKNEDKLFNVNPGKVDYIFNEKTHPYFKMEKQFKPIQKDNFGFKMPEK